MTTPTTPANNGNGNGSPDIRAMRFRHRRGFIVAPRGDDGFHLGAHNKNAFFLAYVIAQRAWRKANLSPKGCSTGEALLGDCAHMGMTQKEYRTAKKILEKAKIAAFKRANRGTIAKLVNTAIFDVNLEPEGEQKGDQGVIRGQSEGEQRATNNKCKKENPERRLEEPAARELGTGERINLEQELGRVEEAIRQTRDQGGYDAMGCWQGDEFQQEKMDKLKDRREQIKQKLGWIA